MENPESLHSAQPVRGSKAGQPFPRGGTDAPQLRNFSKYTSVTRAESGSVRNGR